MTDAFWTFAGIFATAAFGAFNVWIAQGARRAATEAKKEASEANAQSSKNAGQLSQVYEKVNGNLENAVQQARKRVPPQVLIIDDSDDDQELQAILLRKCGCEVFQAKTGIEAEALILSRIRGQRGFPFDWAFLDIKLARGEDARDVIRILDRIVPDMFVAILTGFPSPEIVEELCKEGRFVISKPLNERHIRRMIHNLGLE